MKKFVISYGGVGTHMLKPMITDEDWLGESIRKDSPSWMQYPHHLRVPPSSFKDLGYSKEVKVIYVFGDPINSILSHFRRNNDVKNNWAKHHCINVQGNHQEFNSDWVLDDYLKNGKDLFKLEEHFDNWINAKNLDYDLMLLRYETSYKYENEIKSFLETDVPLNYRARSSDWKTLDESKKEKLQKMYGSLLNKINNFVDLKIVLKNENSQL